MQMRPEDNQFVLVSPTCFDLKETLLGLNPLNLAEVESEEESAFEM